MALRSLLIIVGACLLWGGSVLGQGNPDSAISQAGSGHKTNHIATKDDLHAIGSRNIGGKGFGNWYSLESEISLGRDYSRAVEENCKVLTDPVIAEYVNRVGQNIVRNSDSQVPFTIKVIDSDEINAFALPGGFLYVNRALLTAAEGEAELAAVMAHEIAHVAAHHATRQMTHSQILSLATIPLVFVGGGVGLAIREGVALATPITMTKFSRTFEAEADYLGVEYLYQAGYDPQAFISFFERIHALEKQKPGIISKMFSNHPQTADRIRKTQLEVARILPPRETYVVSTSEFDDVKSRLAEVERRRLAGEGDRGHPTLRRRTSDKPEDSDEDGEPPTLKRLK